MSIGELQKAVPDISVVILTFNSEKFILSCLDSVCGAGCKRQEVIIVDNGSSDRTVPLIRERFPAVTLIVNTENKGASEARNQGIERSLGRWVLTLDSDVVLGGLFLEKLLGCLDTFPPEVGMVQPKILKSDGKTIYSCGILLSWARRLYDIGSGRRERGQYNSLGSVFGPCSAAALYKRRMLEETREETGYFDKRFFFLVEDVDLAWRAGKRGWVCVFLPGIVCFHAGNSSGVGKKERQYLCARNRYLAICKNDGFFRYLKKIVPVLLYDLPRLCFLLFFNPFFRKALRKTIHEV